MRKTSVLAAVVLSTFGAGLIGCDDDNDLFDIDRDIDFTATLTAAAEIPPPVGSPTASGVAEILLRDRVLTVTIAVVGDLTSAVTMAHIHGPASTTETAPIMLDFVPTMAAVISNGTRTGAIVSASYDLDNLPVGPTEAFRVTPEQLIRVLARGEGYVNVHTVTNPDGELRGQIGIR